LLSAVFHKFGDVFYPTPTLALPLKGREITMFLPLQGGGREGDGLSVGAIWTDIVFMKRTTKEGYQFMIDLIYILIPIIFFGLCGLYAKACERL
jgi:hypothetical protein